MIKRKRELTSWFKEKKNSKELDRRDIEKRKRM
jgi:hypothetical protein